MICWNCLFSLWLTLVSLYFQWNSKTQLWPPDKHRHHKVFLQHKHPLLLRRFCLVCCSCFCFCYGMKHCNCSIFLHVIFKPTINIMKTLLSGIVLHYYYSWFYLMEKLWHAIIKQIVLLGISWDNWGISALLVMNNYNIHNVSVDYCFFISMDVTINWK